MPHLDWLTVDLYRIRVYKTGLFTYQWEVYKDYPPDMDTYQTGTARTLGGACRKAKKRSH